VLALDRGADGRTRLCGLKQFGSKNRWRYSCRIEGVRTGDHGIILFRRILTSIRKPAIDGARSGKCIDAEGIERTQSHLLPIRARPLTNRRPLTVRLGGPDYGEETENMRGSLKQFAKKSGKAIQRIRSSSATDRAGWDTASNRKERRHYPKSHFENNGKCPGTRRTDIESTEESDPLISNESEWSGEFQKTDKRIQAPEHFTRAQPKSTSCRPNQSFRIRSRCDDDSAKPLLPGRGRRRLTKAAPGLNGESQ